jgi:hypothetical protein
MLVVVIFVDSMAMAVVDVVDMVLMRHGNMPAALTMRVTVSVMCLMRCGLALVVVIVVSAVQVAVVDVVDMVLMRHGNMPAAHAVNVVVTGVLLVCHSHSASWCVNRPYGLTA